MKSGFVPDSKGSGVRNDAVVSGAGRENRATQKSQQGAENEAQLGFASSATGMDIPSQFRRLA